MSAVLEPEPAKVGKPERIVDFEPVRIDPDHALFEPWAVAAMAAIVASAHL